MNELLARECNMPLEKSVTKYQTDGFSQEDMLKDHTGRIYKSFRTSKEEYEKTGSAAALELASNGAQTYMIINDVQKGVCAALLSSP